MEESMDSVQEVKPSVTQNKILPFILIVVLLVGLGVFVFRNSNKEKVLESGKSVDQKPIVTQTITPTIISSYKNGTFKAVGSYKSPAGDETVDVSITLKDNVVTETKVTPNATNPKSVYFQGLFVKGVNEVVVGKNINEVNLDKVSGSSLTPKGFNDAIEKIKAEAKV